MGAGQRETGRGMVEGRRGPAGGGVAGHARVTDIVGDVVRIGRGREGGLVTGIAISRCVLETRGMA